MNKKSISIEEKSLTFWSTVYLLAILAMVGGLATAAWLFFDGSKLWSILPTVIFIGSIPLSSFALKKSGQKNLQK